MSIAVKIMGMLVSFVARLITGAQGHWKGCPPEALQRIYFANHQSHLDWVLIWAALPDDLRVRTRPIAARDYWTASPFKHWLTREVFHAVYVSRTRAKGASGSGTDDHEDPLEPLADALNQGDSLVIFPEGTRSNKGEPQAFKSGLFHLAEQFPGVQLVPVWIDNVQRVMPKGEVVPVPILCTATFGAPMQIEPGEDKREFLDRARSAVVALRPGVFMNALRSLGNEQQVALLFLILFGVLGLATVAAFMRSLRPQDAPEIDRHERLWRDLRAVWIGSVVFWLSWLSGPLGATLLFGVLSLIALREFITLAHTRRSDHRSLILAFFVVLPLQYVLVGLRTFDLFTVFIPVYVFLAIPVLSAMAGDPERFLERNAKIQWGIMVCVFGLSHAPALLLLELPRYQDRGAFLLFFLVVVTGSAQIVQELASRWLRRRPVARRIDRSFSFRAWGLGAAGAALVGGMLFWITPVPWWQAMAWAFVVGACGTLGDFVMRALKKDAGVRYWGNQSSVTGAVGLLDRVAPLCFAAPVFFHSVRWFSSLSQ